MNIKAIFASRLKQLREEKGLSQSELGEKLGVSRGTISFYESEKRTADIEFLAAAANFFQVDYDYLMGVSSARIGKNEAQKTLDDMVLSDEAIKKLTELNNNYPFRYLNFFLINPKINTLFDYINQYVNFSFYATTDKYNRKDDWLDLFKWGYLVLDPEMSADFYLQRIKDIAGDILTSTYHNYIEALYVGNVSKESGDIQNGNSTKEG